MALTTPIGETGVTLANRIKEARAEQKRLEEQEKADKAALMEILGSAKVGTFHGVVVVTVKPQSRAGVNGKMLAEVYPEVAAAVATKTTFSRIEIA